MTKRNKTYLEQNNKINITKHISKKRKNNNSKDKQGKDTLILQQSTRNDEENENIKNSLITERSTNDNKDNNNENKKDYNENLKHSINNIFNGMYYQTLYMDMIQQIHIDFISNNGTQKYLMENENVNYDIDDIKKSNDKDKFGLDREDVKIYSNKLIKYFDAYCTYKKNDLNFFNPLTCGF